MINLFYIYNRYLINIFILTLLCLLVSARAFAAVHVSVSFVIVDKEVSPRQETRISDHNWGTGFTLKGDEVTRHNGDVIVTSKLDKQFNVALPNINVLTSYRLHSGIITETEITLDQRRVIDISTNGTDRCVARVRFLKVGGQKLFRFRRDSNGETFYVSDRHAERIECKIFATDDN